MIGDYRMQQSTGFEVESRIGVVTKRTGLGPQHCCVKESEVANGPHIEATHEMKKILQSEILDLGHTEPSRSSTSPHRSIIRSVLAATRFEWPARS
jgi:hypothetical protein